MDPPFIIREYQPGDEEGIVEALKANFPRWKIKENAIDFWKWKYLESPLKAYIAVSLLENKIVGVNHDLRLNLKVGSSILLTHWTDDLCVFPDYRAMGLWNKMRKYRNEGPEYKNLKFKYSSSSNEIVKNDWIKKGVNLFPHDIVYMVRVKDVALHIKNKHITDPLLASAGISLLKNLNRLKPKKSLKKQSDYKLVKVELFDDRINEFWDKVKENYKFILERKKDFLNWRFSSHMSIEYQKILAVNDAGEILGYVVLRKDTLDNYDEGFVFDILALPNRDDVVYSLQVEACRYFDEIGVNIIYYRCAKGHPYQKIFGGDFTTMPGKELYISYESLTGDKKEVDILKSSKKSEISLSYADTF